MPRWLPRILQRIQELAPTGRIRLTYKAQREALALGPSPEDVRDVVAGLGVHDSAGRLASAMTGEWMCVFKPEVGGQIIYLKLVIREECLVVSFHDDEGSGHEEDE